MGLKNFLTPLIIFSYLFAFGQEYDSIYGKPLIVLTETNPWAVVLGADIPKFALYEKGQIIYQQVENSQLKLYEVTLTKDEIQKFITSLPIATADKLPDYIEGISMSVSDQPTNKLTLNFDSVKTVNVYGLLGKVGDARANTPAAFLTIYDSLHNYKSNLAKEWLPAKVEVIFWDYNYAPKTRPWIKDFPDLNSPLTKKYNNDSYSVYFDKQYYTIFKDYYSSMEYRQAVEISGRKMSISYRLPFPNMQQ